MATPRRNSKPVQFYARPDLYEKVHAAARTGGLSVSEFMENLVAEALAGEDFGDDPRKVAARVAAVEEHAADLERRVAAVEQTTGRIVHMLAGVGGALAGEDASAPTPVPADVATVPQQPAKPEDAAAAAPAHEAAAKPKRARRRTG